MDINTFSENLQVRIKLLSAMPEQDTLIALGKALKYEVSRGGALFPHLYADLPLSAVLWVKPMPLGANGVHSLPAMDR